MSLAIMIGNSISGGGLARRTYLSLPGVAGNYASVPDAAALDIVGDLDVRAVAALTDWSSASAVQEFASKWGAAGQRSFIFRVQSSGGTGKLRLVWSADGTANAGTPLSTVEPTIANGVALLVRATLDVDNGAAGNDTAFYTKAYDPKTFHADLLSNSGWTQLGTTVTGVGVTSIFSSTAPVEMGASTGGTAGPILGKYYGTVIKSGIAGTTVLDTDFTNGPAGATSLTAVSGQTITINQSGGTPAQIVAA